jgi:UDP-N-acetylglucosamine diphosphorylase/glucosamine-1-phosphate N-acetyltransferase
LTDRIVDEVASLIVYPWDLLRVLDKGIAIDFTLLTQSRRSQPKSRQITVLGKHPVFIARGAKLSTGIFNATDGPIYIGSGAHVQEGAMIRGPFLLGDGAVVTMGAKLYGPAAIGNACIVGGEIKRSLLFPYSNKAHEGYMGDSVVGSWCNWGAGTSNSNIKNTAGSIRVLVAGKEVVVGQKCGVFMGDHSRTAINASLNSGTIVGVSTQVGTGGLAEKRIPSFRWMDGKRYRFQEATEHIRNWKALKGETLLLSEIEQLNRIYKSDK